VKLWPGYHWLKTREFSGITVYVVFDGELLPRLNALLTFPDEKELGIYNNTSAHTAQ